MIIQPPYSPDIAPCDFLLFRKLKSTLSGRRFANLDKIKSVSLKELKAISKRCFGNWKKYWHWFVISNFKEKHKFTLCVNTPRLMDAYFGTNIRYIKQNLYVT